MFTVKMYMHELVCNEQGYIPEEVKNLPKFTELVSCNRFQYNEADYLMLIDGEEYSVICDEFPLAPTLIEERIGGMAAYKVYVTDQFNNTVFSINP